MLSEKEIRPAELQKIQEKLYLADVRKFTGRLNEFIPCDCPVCASKDHALRYSKLDLTFSECNRCGTIFTNPRPGHNILKEYYSSSENYQFWAKHIFPATEATRRDKIVAPRVDLLDRLCTENDVSRECMLEIGPGFGTFCRLVKERRLFREIHAIEPTPELADALEHSGITVTRKFFEDIDLVAFADAIVAFEVIEHIPDPGDFIERCGRVLKPGGLLLITCPNGKGFDTLVLGEDAPALDFEHVTLFNPGSLTGLLQKHGFSIVRMETPGVLDTDIVRNRIADSGMLKEKLPLYHAMFCEQWSVFGESFQEYLQKNMLSGNLLVAGIKSK